MIQCSLLISKTVYFTEKQAVYMQFTKHTQTAAKVGRKKVQQNSTFLLEAEQTAVSGISSKI